MFPGRVRTTQGPTPSGLRKLRESGYVNTSTGVPPALMSNAYIWGDTDEDAINAASCNKRWTAISLGGRHAAGITASGDLYMWGGSQRGQCGPEAVSAAAFTTLQLVRLPPAVQVQAVACGGEHTLALTAGVGVLAWGCNRLGQCGMGQCDTIWRPEAVPSLLGTPVSQLAAGRGHSMVLTAQSQVLTFGGNGAGQLGLGDRAPRSVPTLVEGLWALPVVQIAAGDAFSAAVTSSGHAFLWGSNHHGQLGLLREPFYEQPDVTSSPARGQHASNSDQGHRQRGGATAAPWTGAAHPISPPAASTPRSLRRATMRRNGSVERPDPQWLLAMLEMGIPRRHAQVALEETGNAGVEVATEWLFAADRTAILDELSDDEAVPSRSAAGGAVQAPVRTGGGQVMSPRINDAGSTHTIWPTDELLVLEPRRVPLKGILQLATGAHHTVAITESGVYAWGNGRSGALGLGDDFEDRDMPSKIECFTGTPCGSITASSAPAAPHVLEEGALRAAGMRLGGQQATRGGGGAGPRVSSASTVGIRQVACGAQHTLFLAHDGSLYWCGTMAVPQGPLAVADFSDLGSRRDRPAASQAQECPAVLVSGLPQRLDTVPGLASNKVAPSSATGLAVGPLRVYDIVARGACSAVLLDCSTSGSASGAATQMLDASHLLDKLRTSIEGALKAQATANVDLSTLSASLKAVTSGLQMLLSSPAAISAAFGRRCGMGLDGPLFDNVLASVQQLLAARPTDSAAASASTVADLHRFNVVAELQRAAATLVDDLAAHVRLLGTPERAQVLLAALQHPLLSDPACARRLLPKLAATVLAAPAVVRTWLVRWWTEYPGSLLEARVVQPLQAYLTRELGATKKLTTAIMNVVKLLARVEAAANLSCSLPPEAFYNSLISDKLDVQDHYTAWRQAQDLATGRNPPPEAPFSFCSYPFLLNARAKSHLLHLEARLQMEQSVAHARMELQLYGRGIAARRRAEEEVVAQMKAASAPPPAAQQHASNGTGPGGRPARHGRPPVSGSQGGAVASSSGSIARDVAARSSPGSGAAGTSSARGAVGGPLRSLLSMLRRRHSFSGVGGSSAGNEAAAQGGGGQRARTQGTCLGLPSPSECSVPAVHSDMCILRVRRTHLVDDALAEIGRQVRRDLLKPLRVHFIGEDGIDAGGVKKEFFLLLVDRLLSPDYSMMVYDETSRTFWFNPSSLEPPESFFLLGLAISLAVYNRVLLAFPAPLLLYQKLRGGRELGLRDLEGWQPELARGLKMLLEYDGPEPLADVFGVTFSVDVDRFGHIHTLPLKPGGDQIFVTEDNRAEYVSLLAAWHMNSSVEAQFDAFAAGFRVLCDGPALSLFNAQELERLVCGNPRLDFLALRDAARYDGGFTRETPVVQWLWSIVLYELAPEDQRAFLKFFTGSDRSPIGGLGSLRPVIQRDGPDSHKLPTSHTCFNTLLLPGYSSPAKLKAKLLLAIENAQGFGLR